MLAFSENAALAVCDTPVETLDTLTDQGLLEFVPPDRYTLHQTIAEYARFKLRANATKERAAQERLAVWRKAQ